MLESIITGVIVAIVAGLILDWIRHRIRKRPSVIAKLIEWVFSIFRRRPPEGPPSQKLLIYLSEGGTCRDPMAKAITLKILENKAPHLLLRVEGMALGRVSGNEVSFAARSAIKELYGDDLLKGYKPQRVTQELLNEADLILVMDHKLMEHKSLKEILPKRKAAYEFPKGKTFVFKEFFGLKGNIEDPWPDGRDQETLSRYKARAKEIKWILENNFERLLKAF